MGIARTEKGIHLQLAEPERRRETTKGVGHRAVRAELDRAAAGEQCATLKKRRGEEENKNRNKTNAGNVR